MVKTSNQAILIAQPSMNKRRLSQASLLRLPICFFQGREKAKWFRLPICFFPGLEKAKRLRLPICFFPAREKGKLFQISNLLFPNPGKSNRKSEEQLFLQRGQVTNMTCADLSQDLREPFATAVRAHSKSAFEIRSLTRKRWVFERRSCKCMNIGEPTVRVPLPTGSSVVMYSDSREPPQASPENCLCAQRRCSDSPGETCERYRLIGRSGSGHERKEMKGKEVS